MASARLLALGLLVGATAPASADDAAPPALSDTQVIERWGATFEEPGITGHVAKHVVTFQHFDAWAYGRNFFFFDTVLPWGHTTNYQALYGEAYSSLGLSALTKHALAWAFIKDLDLTAGLNAGASSTGAAPLVILPGASIDFAVPGFAFVSLDVLAFIDRGRFDGMRACHATGLQLTASWQRAFHAGPFAGTFEGYGDFITAHGGCATQILAQPQLRLDVGRWFDLPQRLFVGFELEIWRGKYGIAGLDEYVPRTVAVWRF